MKENVKIFSDNAFIPEEKFKHAFFTRKGGVSSGLYHALNVGRGSKDNPDNITQNREIVKKTLNADALIFVHQSHSADVITVHHGSAYQNQYYKADAMVTNIPHIALAIQTADCVPILFADVEKNIIAAAHAGWRGAKSGIIQNTIREMKKIGASISHIRAIIGPAISMKNYEVDNQFYQSFIEDDKKNEIFFSPAKNKINTHKHFNLPQYVITKLERESIRTHHIPLCTYQESDLFFSYRRATHKKEKDYGRHVSTIMIS